MPCRYFIPFFRCFPTLHNISTCTAKKNKIPVVYFLDCSIKLDKKSGGVLELNQVMEIKPAIYDCIWIIKRPQGRTSDGILLRLVEIVMGQGKI